MRIKEIEIEDRFDFVPHCETSSQNAGKQVRPAQVQLHRRVPEIIQPRAAGVRGLSSVQQIELSGENRQVFREILSVLQSRQCRVILAAPWNRHRKIREGHSAVDLVAVLTQTCLAAKIEVSALPQSDFLCVDIGQVVTTAAVSESLLQSARRHTLIKLCHVAKERHPIVRKYVPPAIPIAGQFGSRPKIVDPWRGRSVQEGESVNLFRQTRFRFRGRFSGRRLDSVGTSIGR